MNSSKHPNRVKAESAIKEKTKVLEKWVDAKKVPWKVNYLGEPERDEKGELQADYVPLSLDDFCKWDGSQNCAFNRLHVEGLDALQSISPSTIHQPYHQDARRTATNLFRTIRKVIEAQVIKENKSSQIEALLAENGVLQALVNQQETEILRMRSEMMDTERSLNQLKRAHKNGQEELQRQLRELQELNAGLAATVSKLVPFKAAKG